MTPFSATISPIHSGSVILHARHIHGTWLYSGNFWSILGNEKLTSYDKVLEIETNAIQHKFILSNLLRTLKEQGKLIYAYGAPAKGNTILNWLGLDTSIITKAVEINPLKIGKYTPGTYIPVVQESMSDQPDYYLLLSHNFKDEILEKYENTNVKFIDPFDLTQHLKEVMN